MESWNNLVAEVIHGAAALSSPGHRSVRRRFGLNVALRILATCVCGCLTGFLLFDSPYWMAGIWTGLATIGLFYQTVRYVDLSERKLTAFLQSLKQNDFSATFSESALSDDYDLHRAFNQLNEMFKNLRSDKESQHHLLQVVVEHAAVPLVCFDEADNGVYLINEAAKDLFQIPFLQKISSLGRVEPSLPEFIRNIKDGDKASLKLTLKGKTQSLSVTSRHLVFGGKNLKLIALTDVSSELAARDAEAWQKLLRVLTHEIANSAIPLSTLSSYINELVTVAETENRTLSADERRDVLESLRTIDQRSKSLKQFVANFKSVNQVPEPEMAKILAKELVDEISQFFSKDLEKEKIELHVTVVENASLFADRNLTMQTLINLMKNAIESMSNMKEGKAIHISVEKNGTHFTHFRIADKGCGIPAEETEQIFVPFYSTKKGGSGIGLSIAHQIMQKQKGDLSVVSEPGKGSVFTASFIS